MFGKIGLPEILILLVIVLLVFGVGRISKVSGELGKSIRLFRDNLNGAGNDANDESENDEKA